ncbi:MAG: alpha/beta fold hydrolase [Polyangiales bacterium]
MPTRSPYALERAGHATKLLRPGPSPQPFSTQLAPSDAHVIEYRSGTLSLPAYVNAAIDPSSSKPAVLFLHGEFAFDNRMWEQCRAFRDAGWITMVPILRGENGAPGSFTLYHDELDDVLAARAALASIRGVDAARVFSVGHSAGAVLAMLAALYAPVFRKVVSISGWPEIEPVLRWYPEYCTFDASDPRELRLRSPLRFARWFTAPVRAVFGREERQLRPWIERLVLASLDGDHAVEACEVEGDHFSVVEPAMREALRWFCDGSISER